MERTHRTGRDVWSRRPTYTPRQTLTAEQLNAALHDDLERQHILNRAVLGYGVVIGYDLAVDEDGALDLRHGRLDLGDGLALDRHGRMLVWEGGRLGIDDLVGESPSEAGSHVLIAHYAVRSVDRDGCSPCDGRRPSWTDHGVVFSLRPDGGDAGSGCPEHPWRRCVDHGEYLHRRTGGLQLHLPSVEESPDVSWYAEVPPPPRESCQDGWEYDPRPEVGVPLARVEICRSDGDDHRPEQEADGCEPRFGFCRRSAPEVTTVRPLVYRNPLLYELVRCCDTDLPRVDSVSWQDWIEAGWRSPVPWKEFEERVTSGEDGFRITFTKPVDPLTLHDASIFITAFHQDDDGSWRSYRVPLSELAPIRERDKVLGVRLVPEAEEWVGAEVTGRRSHLVDGARIEITVRGQLVRDECGRMLDARPLDVDCGDHCQARPGGDLVSAFQVGANPGDRRAPGTSHGNTEAGRGTAAAPEGA